MFRSSSTTSTVFTLPRIPLDVSRPAVPCKRDVSAGWRTAGSPGGRRSGCSRCSGGPRGPAPIRPTRWRRRWPRGWRWSPTGRRRAPAMAAWPPGWPTTWSRGGGSAARSDGRRRWPSRRRPDVAWRQRSPGPSRSRGSRSRPRRRVRHRRGARSGAGARDRTGGRGAARGRLSLRAGRRAHRPRPRARPGGARHVRRHPPVAHGCSRDGRRAGGRAGPPDARAHRGRPSRGSARRRLRGSATRRTCST